MNSTTRALVVVTVIAAAGSALRRLAGRARGRSGRDDATRWRVVTVNRPPDELVDQLPAPLADLGDAVEVRVRPAPGDRGAELWARASDVRRLRRRLRKGSEGSAGKPAEAVRAALRRAKQLAEVGWVLHDDQHVTTTPTPLNAPLRAAVRRAGGKGLL